MKNITLQNISKSIKEKVVEDGKTYIVETYTTEGRKVTIKTLYDKAKEKTKLRLELAEIKRKIEDTKFDIGNLVSLLDKAREDKAYLIEEKTKLKALITEYVAPKEKEIETE